MQFIISFWITDEIRRLNIWKNRVSLLKISQINLKDLFTPLALRENKLDTIDSMNSGEAPGPGGFPEAWYLKKNKK